MNIALWIAASALALFMLAAGFMKVSRPIQEIRKMPWAAKMPANYIRLIGSAEILGALGLVLPLATGMAVILTPVAALCLAVLMAGATITHIRIKDPKSAALTTTVLMALALFVAFGRFSGLN
ncbi:MAG: DoxX family protein [Actinobacteria bacterium]|uniref:Unannotated protein n=1 Tax=freshwater metagenome TaxID=449393 RepID=A0A6J6N8I8_9ZZZZ|nr:DoxX family protein [Actinomycetota bacterium]